MGLLIGGAAFSGAQSRKVCCDLVRLEHAEAAVRSALARLSALLFWAGRPLDREGGVSLGLTVWRDHSATRRMGPGGRRAFVARGLRPPPSGARAPPLRWTQRRRTGGGRRRGRVFLK